MLNIGAINWGSPINQASPLNRGLVSWWLANGPTVGSVTWRDLCRRNDGTLTSMDPATDWVTAKRTGGVYSLDLDGSDYVQLGDLPSGTFSADFTFSAWVYPRALALATIFFCKRTGATAGIVIWHNSSVFSTRIDATDCTGSALSTNVWQHIVSARTGSTVELYVNAVAQSVTGNPNANDGSNTQPAVIGARSFTTATNYLNGIIDDVRIWDRRLSPDEVSQLYTDSLTGYQQTLNRLQRRFAYSAAAPATSVPAIMYHRRRLSGAR